MKIFFTTGTSIEEATAWLRRRTDPLRHFWMLKFIDGAFVGAIWFT